MLEVTPHPIHPDFIVELNFLGCIGIKLAQNIGILIHYHLAKLKARLETAFSSRNLASEPCPH
jgi:hypothetical protein